MKSIEIVFVFLVAFGLLGCSGGGDDSSTPEQLLPPGEEIIQPVSPPSQDMQDETPLDQNPPAPDPSPQISFFDEPYSMQQWALYENSSFYTQNRIVSGASIQGAQVLREYRGRGVKIAIIDDGFDTSHEDLQGAMSASFDLETRTSDVSHSSSGDMHGTAVAGIVAARVNTRGIAGVASESEIIFLKFKRFMSDSEIIELFDKAAALGADIISNSWGTGNASPALRAKIADLATNGRGGRGISIVFAAGNGSQNIYGDESSIPEVISVGATNKYNVIADYSNFGANLDIVAPGGEYLGITTLDPMRSAGIASRDNDYLLYNDSNGFVGTSASAPIVSGIIALMLEKNPNLRATEIESILKNTADKIGTVFYGLDGHNDYYGHGKVNLTSAMNEL